MFTAKAWKPLLPGTLSTLCVKILNHAVHATEQILTKFKTERVALKGTPLPTQPDSAALAGWEAAPPSALKPRQNRTRTAAGGDPRDLLWLAGVAVWSRRAHQEPDFGALRLPGTGRLSHDALGAQRGNPEFS